MAPWPGDNVANRQKSQHCTGLGNELCEARNPRFVRSGIEKSIAFRAQVEFKSRGQVSREAGFSKPVEARQYFVTRPVILLTNLGIAATCCEHAAMCDGDSTAEPKMCFGRQQLRAIHDGKITLHDGGYVIDVQVDSFSVGGSKIMGFHQSRRGQLRH